MWRAWRGVARGRTALHLRADDEQQRGDEQKAARCLLYGCHKRDKRRDAHGNDAQLPSPEEDFHRHEGAAHSRARSEPFRYRDCGGEQDLQGGVGAPAKRVCLSATVCRQLPRQTA